MSEMQGYPQRNQSNHGRGPPARPPKPTATPLSFPIYDPSRKINPPRLPRSALLTSYEHRAGQLLVPGCPPKFRLPPLPLPLAEGPPVLPRQPDASLRPMCEALWRLPRAPTSFDVLTLRFNLNQILGTPYTKESWALVAHRVGSCLVLDARLPPDSTDPHCVQCSQWGYVFWHACTEAHDSGPIDPKDEFCGVFSLNLDGLHLGVSADLACYDDSAAPPPSRMTPAPPSAAATLELDRFVEIKTHKLLVTERDQKNFRTYRALKFFLESFVVGVPRLFIGERDQSGVITKTRMVPTADLSKMARGDYRVCFAFAAELLRWLREHVPEGCPHRVRCEAPFERVVLEAAPEEILPVDVAALLLRAPGL